MIGNIEIYQAADGPQIEVKFEKETIWLTQRQMAELFGKDVRTINEHLKNIYDTGELEKNRTVRKFRIVQKEGNRQVNRELDHYNLDAIISVGYRVNSKRGTQFRIWATQRLKEFLVQGYAINEKRLEQTKKEVKVLKSGISMLSRAIESTLQQEESGWLETFSTGLQLLDDYDHELLDQTGLTTSSACYPSREAYDQLIRQMKDEFKSDVFGVERDGGFESAIHQIAQGFGTADLYPSLEEKAAMLLYLVIKNHAFTDGNKRIAAACFLLFLNENQLIMTSQGTPVISNEALASLTLLVASSKPEEMETIKRLIISVLNRNRHPS